MTVKELGDEAPKRRWKSFFGRSSANDDVMSEEVSEHMIPTTKWSMGVMNDPTTHEVPGSVLLLAGNRNEPLGLRHTPGRTSSSSLPSQFSTPQASKRPSSAWENKKKTQDGAIILEPQPDDSQNDPLNWPSWRRDTALLSLGFYCMVGGGMTPILAAGFTNVAKTYHVTVPQVALTTGLYMMGLGLGSVVASPTAILYGKRPVYLVGSLIFIVASVWCALSPSYTSLVIARIVQGMAVSPVECLPSATIAEIFFLHERAYRIGIYGLLLLGGKNLIPLVSAAIIQRLNWRWVFWIVAMVVGFCFVLLFLFVPETFWDRTPRPKSRTHSGRATLTRMFSSFSHHDTNLEKQGDAATDVTRGLHRQATRRSASLVSQELDRRGSSATRPSRPLHVGFAPDDELPSEDPAPAAPIDESSTPTTSTPADLPPPSSKASSVSQKSPEYHKLEDNVLPTEEGPPTPALHNFNSPFYSGLDASNSYFMERDIAPTTTTTPADPVVPKHTLTNGSDQAKSSTVANPPSTHVTFKPNGYTNYLQGAPPRSFSQQLKPWNGRLTTDKWVRVAIRPFILYAYPAVLWSSIVYSCSIGWLIVLSESVAAIYRSPKTYNFSALSTGLIYLSPFIGGILGTAVAGKVSDIIVRAMSRRNGGLYEPEFRLVMAIPVTIATVIGLMGFGWAAQEHDAWIVPTIFFGIISFGCSLGSTTAITFCVDSYRQYAGEALVTLNFSKNIFHGLVFSLFFNRWLEADGSKKVFVALGAIQLVLMLLTIPMYIFGKRARMWTVRKNFMEKF